MSLVSRYYQREAERQLYRCPDLAKPNAIVLRVADDIQVAHSSFAETPPELARIIAFFSTVSVVTRKAGYVLTLSLPGKTPVAAGRHVGRRKKTVPLDIVSLGLSALRNMTTLELARQEIPPPGYCDLSLVEKVHQFTPSFRLIRYTARDITTDVAGNLHYFASFFESQVDIVDFETCMDYPDGSSIRTLHAAPWFPRLKIADVWDPRWLQCMHCHYICRLATSLCRPRLEPSYTADFIGRCGAALRHLKLSCRTFRLRIVDEFLRSLAGKVALESLTLVHILCFSKDIYLRDVPWTALNDHRTISTLIMSFYQPRDGELPCDGSQIRATMALHPNIKRFAIQPASAEDADVAPDGQWATYRRNEGGEVELEGYGTLDEASWRKL